MKAILNSCRITVPKTSAQPWEWEIDGRICEEVERRLHMSIMSRTTKNIQSAYERECSISDLITLIALTELGWARGKTRFKRYLEAQSRIEKKFVDKHGGTVVLGAKTGSDEWERAEDMREDLKRYIQSYGFDYDKFLKELKHDD